MTGSAARDAAPTPGEAVCVCGHPMAAHVDGLGCSETVQVEPTWDVFCACRRAIEDRAEDARGGGQ